MATYGTAHNGTVAMVRGLARAAWSIALMEGNGKPE